MLEATLLSYQTTRPCYASRRFSLYASNFQLNSQDYRKIQTTNHIFLPQVEELAEVWLSYVEMELRHECYEEAQTLLNKATTPPPHKPSYYDRTEPVQNRVYRNLKLWSLYADLEESLGTFTSTKNVYYKILDLKIASPQIILNFSEILEEKNYFEESFKVYERGVAMFKWPLVFELWTTYLTKFVKRYVSH